MCRISSPALSLGISTNGWLPAWKELCLCLDSNLGHNVSLRLTGKYVKPLSYHGNNITIVYHYRSIESLTAWGSQRLSNRGPHWISVLPLTEFGQYLPNSMKKRSFENDKVQPLLYRTEGCKAVFFLLDFVRKATLKRVSWETHCCCYGRQRTYWWW